MAHKYGGYITGYFYGYICGHIIQGYYIGVYIWRYIGAYSREMYALCTHYSRAHAHACLTRAKSTLKQHQAKRARGSQAACIKAFRGLSKVRTLPHCCMCYYVSIEIERGLKDHEPGGRL